MGKIRVRTLGDEEQEQEQKNEAKKRQETKKTEKAPGMKGGERVVSVGPSEEELARLDESTTRQAKIDLQEKSVEEPGKEAKKEKKAKKTKTKARPRSTKYKAAVILIDKTKTYPLTDALETLPKVKLSKFDETVELHITALEKGITGTVTLPHGTGKEKRIAVVDEALIKTIETGKVDFDILLASPDMMPKLAKVARILGPKGLMPNPKNGTITTNPADAMKKFSGGHMSYKTESKNPIIHMSVGKMSFGTKKLEENIKTVLSSLPATKIKKVTLKSTMSPGIKISFQTLS